MDRHVQPELDAPTERIWLQTPRRMAGGSEPSLPSWVYPGLLSLLGVAVVVALVLATSSSSSGSSNTALPSTGSAPPSSSVNAAAADRYLTRLTDLDGDLSFYGAQYGRERTRDHAEAYLAAGSQACKLGRDEGYTDTATAQALQSSWTPTDLGDPPTRAGYIDSDLALKMVQSAWQYLC